MNEQQPQQPAESNASTVIPSLKKQHSKSTSIKQQQPPPAIQLPLSIPATPGCPLCLFQSPVFFSVQFKRFFFSCLQCSLVFAHPQHHVSASEEKHRYSTHNNNKLNQGYVDFLMPAALELLERVFSLNEGKLGHDIRGLDYGCGPNATLSHLLKERGLVHVDDYDPFFYPNPRIDSIVIPFNKDEELLQENPIPTQTTTTTAISSSQDSTGASLFIPPQSITLDDESLPTASSSPSSTCKLYDFITCTETVEHFYVPYIDWRKLTTLLRRGGGVLVVMTSLLYSDEQFENWWYLRDITHVSLYRPKTMEYIAKDLGLELIWPLERKNIAVFIVH